jgi:phage repressor protein C with HTH and peptisase S24 domain
MYGKIFHNSKLSTGIFFHKLFYMGIDEVLKQYMKEQKQSLTVFAENAGVSRDRLAKWTQGKAKPNYEDLQKIAAYMGVSADELLGKNLPQHYIEKRRQLKNTNQEHEIMYYEIGADAGHSSEVLPVKKNEGKLIVSDLFKGSDFAIRVNGDSMMPSYPPNAILGIREIQDKHIQPGHVYVIEYGNDLKMKRIFYKDDDQESGVWEMISDNDTRFEKGPRQGKLHYPPFYVDVDKVRRLFKVTGMFKNNEITLIS